ncbi:MAG: patatin-like phospholipase family protein [Anaerolineae bacterium]
MKQRPQEPNHGLGAPEQMIASVLSAGGNRGPLEVGALQVLLEHGIQPDMLNGTSAGAISAIFLAVDPTPGSALDLGEMWKRVDTKQVLQGNRLTMLCTSSLARTTSLDLEPHCGDDRGR